ncbi:rabn-5 [Pristionchus pacificus]|nr:rabn-5 [Pristionchus pacificus]
MSSSTTMAEGELISILDATTISPVGSATVSPTPTSSALPCEMCQNYELSLKNAQDSERKMQDELRAARSLAERYESELVEERQYRQNLEKKMMETAAQTEEQLNDSAKSFAALTTRFEEAIQASGKARLETNITLDAAKEHISLLEKEHSDLVDRFEKLLGVKAATAAMMREEPIDLSSDVDSLQFTMLKMREELIECKASKEFREAEMNDEITALATQLQEEKGAKESKEREMMAQLNEVQTNLGIANSQISTSEQVAVKSDAQARQITELQQTVAELEQQVQQVQSERKAVEQTSANFRQRCSALQHELDVSEQVQKDFVQLSQSLQIQLEKIRQSDQEVRWQWEDEVSECSAPSCTQTVARLRPKPRCMHCGKIFCAPCVSTTVPAGKNNRPAPVCAVCHTLLNKDSAPFFSREPNK